MPKKDLENRKSYLIEKDLKGRLDELTALYEVSRSITSSENLAKMLKVIVTKVAKILDADACLIYLFNNDGLMPKAAYGPQDSLRKFKQELSSGCGVIKRTIRTKSIVRIGSIPRQAGDRLCAIAKKCCLKSLLLVPLVEKNDVIGILVCCSRRAFSFANSDEKDLTLFASQATMAIENARLFDEIRLHYINTMKLLACVIDAKDTYTEDHSKEVTRIALAIAEKLKLSEKQRTIIRNASMFHDIGKIGIDMGVLRKPGTLGRREWAKMRKHPQIGVDIIKKAGFLDELIPAILYHHVRYSGGGYPPTKRKGDAIPVEARILAVADAYEAMRSDRPYRKRLSKSETVRELKRCSGTQFDPKVVNALLKTLNNY